MTQARATLDLLCDEAWSPVEAIVAAMAALPVTDYGYGLAPLRLNHREFTPSRLASAAARGSRVPDIIFEGTHSGINYDGAVHLDLDSIVLAAQEAAADPDDRELQEVLEGAKGAVRAKVVDDIRRNRELAAMGLSVLPVVKEDLYETGGLDAVMSQVMATIEARGERDLTLQRLMLSSRAAATRRQQLIWSLLPGHKGSEYTRLLVPGKKPVTGPTYEAMLEF